MVLVVRSRIHYFLFLLSFKVFTKRNNDGKVHGLFQLQNITINLPCLPFICGTSII
jgi:hypothetical protein